MKTIYALLISMVFPSLAQAVPNLACGYSGIDAPYQVFFNSEHLTAQVTKDHLPVSFGNLKCYLLRQPYGEVAYCYSPNVYDAGFNASFYRDSSDVFTVQLSQIFLSGPKKLGTLPCFVDPESNF